MKRFLLIPSCALLSLGALTSCQKEDLSVTELASQLTSELQQISDFKTAEALAPRVEVLNKRLQDAGVRTFALEATSLQRGADETEGSEGASYAEALGKLASEVARVQASTPTTDGEIDRDKLVMAVGAANGAGDSAPAAQRNSVGSKFYKSNSESTDIPGNFSEFYGSDKLRAALDYKADPATVSMFQMDDEVPAVPEAAEIPEDEPTAQPEGSVEDASAAEESTPSSDAAEDDKGADISTEIDEVDTSSSQNDDISSISIDSDPSSGDDDSSDAGSSDDLSDDDLDLGIEI